MNEVPYRLLGIDASASALLTPDISNQNGSKLGILISAMEPCNVWVANTDFALSKKSGSVDLQCRSAMHDVRRGNVQHL